MASTQECRIICSFESSCHNPQPTTLLTACSDKGPSAPAPHTPHPQTLERRHCAALSHRQMGTVPPPLLSFVRERVSPAAHGDKPQQPDDRALATRMRLCFQCTAAGAGLPADVSITPPLRLIERQNVPRFAQLPLSLMISPAARGRGVVQLIASRASPDHRSCLGGRQLILHWRLSPY
jgi:hypothetical protein